MNITVDGSQIRETIRRAMDQAQRSLERVRVQAPTMRWDMNESAPPMPPMPPMPAAAPEPLRVIRF
ncbi:MAG: hypothetical protein B7Z72_02695 [Gemmatimonadetes bacterium 21-71-4]|nr:MAG: hypothetical protein B7Z72_02695 [Gemmatimonadetes bacterium 21-71-4]